MTTTGRETERMQDTTTLYTDKVNWSAKHIRCTLMSLDWFLQFVGASKCNRMNLWFPTLRTIRAFGCRPLRLSKLRRFLLHFQDSGLNNCRNSVQHLSLRSQTCAVESVWCLSPHVSPSRKPGRPEKGSKRTHGQTAKTFQKIPTFQTFSKLLLTQVQRGRSLN